MIIWAQGFGQLGNRLFCYAHLQALAARFDTQLIAPAFPYDAYFAPPLSTRQRFLHRAMRRTHFFPGRSVSFFNEESRATQGKLLLNALEKRRAIAVRLDRWLPLSCRQEPPPEVADRIRQHLRPHPRHWLTAENAVHIARENCDILVGVHVRAGDFAEFDGGQWLVGVEEYYIAMLEISVQLRAEYPNTKVAFLVVSDEPRHAEEFGELPVFFGSNHLVEDMAALCQCDFIIKGPLSTFALWSSWWGRIPHLTLREDTLELSSFRVASLKMVGDVPN